MTYMNKTCHTWGDVISDQMIITQQALCSLNCEFISLKRAGVIRPRRTDPETVLVKSKPSFKERTCDVNSLMRRK